MILNRYPANDTALFRIGNLEDEELWLLHRCGMPSDRDLIETSEPGIRYGERFDSFEVEHFGVVAPPDVSYISKSPELPAWIIDNVARKDFPLINLANGVPRPGGTATLTTDDGEQINMHIWRRRVYLQGSKAFIEQIWNPFAGWARQIRNISDANLDSSIVSQIKKLAEGLALITLLEATEHKIVRSDEWSIDEFRKLAFQALETMANIGVKKLSHQRLGKYVGLHRDTIAKYLEREKGLYEELKNELARLRNVE